MGHSMSPVIHNHWLQTYGIDGQYTIVETPPDDLKDRLKQMVHEGWQGCNIGLPYKTTVFSLCDEISQTAQDIKAVNTLIFKPDGTIYGTNTDAYGFTKNLQDSTNVKTVNKQSGQATVLGAGGASRAIVYALIEMGFRRIHMANNPACWAEKIATDFAHLECTFSCGTLEDAPHHFAKTTVLVNATSLGMKGQPPLAVDISSLPMNAIVADAVYTPVMTDLLQTAHNRGHAIADGLGMLLYQAVYGFERWFHHENPKIDTPLRQKVIDCMQQQS